VLHLEYLEQRICSCKDKTCADATQQAFNKWKIEKAIGQEPGFKPQPDHAMTRVAELLRNYQQCLAKLIP
jgi:hypothetical protein